MPQPIRLKDHEKDARLIRARAFVGALVVVVLTAVLGARLYYLQVVQYEYHCRKTTASTCSRSRRTAG
jgi:penicillin-binding protein 2